MILKQLFCDWSTLLPSPRLSNKAWSLFPHILQNVLMRPNPFNSCPNCQSYGYNCVWLCACVCVREHVCVCIWEFWTLSPSPGVKREEQQFPLEGKSHQRHQKIQKGDPKIQFQTKWALSRTTNRPWPLPSLTQMHRNVSELWIKCCKILHLTDFKLILSSSPDLSAKLSPNCGRDKKNLNDSYSQ